ELLAADRRPAPQGADPVADDPVARPEHLLGLLVGVGDEARRVHADRMGGRAELLRGSPEARAAQEASGEEHPVCYAHFISYTSYTHFARLRRWPMSDLWRVVEIRRSIHPQKQRSNRGRSNTVQQRHATNRT